MNYPTDIFVHPQSAQPHPRIIIRNRVKHILKLNTDLSRNDGEGNKIGQWFCSRPKPIFYTETPCGLIYFTNEPADHRKTAPRNYLRKLALSTEVTMVASSERENAIDDWLDSRAFEIEHTLGGDRFLGLKGLVSDVELTRTEPVDVVVDGNIDISAIRLHWDISYQTDLYFEGKLDEFLRYTVLWKDPDAADAVTIREE